ncbi:hypothetical protein CVV65_13605 [Kyrpidia spormannii]|uniref:Uncharacterized protein n=1 Tax=Kyrpidia spormannii TaxID=2055160 RepID=A0A2K8N9P2_9BACL|nr:hypothetical protein [Kyrpidia spormannii]ATY85835.1 hypothetical protein CVV65_13605 [Kyrpidia spormannii]
MPKKTETKPKGIREGLSISTRAYTVIRGGEQDNKTKPRRDWNEWNAEETHPFGYRMLVFDTETTRDSIQKLRFGFARVYESGNVLKRVDEVETPILKRHILFYAEDLPSEEIRMLKDYARQNGSIVVMTWDEFVRDVFMKEICIHGSVIVGFNVPFDVSRIACDVQTFQHGKHVDEFIFDMTGSDFDYRVSIQSLNSKAAFIRLVPPRNQTKKNEFGVGLQGRFLDVRTLIWALHSQSVDLKRASTKLYKVKHPKLDTDEHGKMTMEYIEYADRDPLTTFEVAVEALRDFYRHPLVDARGEPLEPHRMYSAASVGKAYFRAMGIQPFHVQNPDFPPEILGYVMDTYCGGRAECHYRRKPAVACHTDVQSMYPSVFVLQGLWDFVTADKIRYEQCGEEVARWLETLTLDEMLKKETFKRLNVICEVIPAGHWLPTKADYGGNSFNIGINYLDLGGVSKWFTLADLVACKLKTGKVPKILRAYRFIPEGKQETLRPVALLGNPDLLIDPAKDDFFKTVIELRLKYKAMKKDPEANKIQYGLKILANSTSYGVFVELNREELKEMTEVDVYGIEHVKTWTDTVERPGTYFNPIIGTLITGGARMILGIIQCLVEQEGGTYAFTDTDSMCVIDLRTDDLTKQDPYAIAKKVSEKLKCLYPYRQEPGKEKSLLGLEDVNFIDGEYRPLYVVAISAKRYVLFRVVGGQLKFWKETRKFPVVQGRLRTWKQDGKTLVKRTGRKPKLKKRGKTEWGKYTEHGLGHLMQPYPKPEMTKEDFERDLWKFVVDDVLRNHPVPGYTPPQKRVYPDYADLPIMGQFSITKPRLYHMVEREKGKPYADSVKPFGFLTVAYQQLKSLPMFFYDYHPKTIDRYYCRRDRAIANGPCNAKAICQYRDKCLSGLEPSPVTAYMDDVRLWDTVQWRDRATLEPMDIRPVPPLPPDTIMGDVIEVPPISGVYVQTYRILFEEYGIHPESKYDDERGRPCMPYTAGLLYPTYVRAKEIRMQGKVTHTVYVEEENEASGLPDDRLTPILDYGVKPVEPVPDPAAELWNTLREKIRETKGKRKLAGQLEITYDQLKRLMNGTRNPSPKLLSRMAAHFGIENSVANKKDARGPKALETPKNTVYPVGYLATQGVNPDEMKQIFPGTFMELYGVEYVVHTPETKKYVETIRAEQRKRQTREMIDVLINGKISAINTSNPGKPAWIRPDDILWVFAEKTVGRKTWILAVLTKTGEIMVIKQTDGQNQYFFQAGFLPKASQLPQDKYNEITKNGYRKIWTKRVRYVSRFDGTGWCPNIKFEAACKLYQLRKTDLEGVRRDKTGRLHAADVLEIAAEKYRER